MMTITMSSYNDDEYDHEASVSFNETDIYSVMEEIQNLLVGYGFHPKSVKDGILALAEEIKGEYND